MFDSDHIHPGTVWRDVIQTDTNPITRIPLIVVKGAQKGPTLLVTAGIHGAEYASIEAANRLAQIDPKTVSGTFIVLPVVNQPKYLPANISGLHSKAQTLHSRREVLSSLLARSS